MYCDKRCHDHTVNADTDLYPKTFMNCNHLLQMIQEAAGSNGTDTRFSHKRNRMPDRRMQGNGERARIINNRFAVLVKFREQFLTNGLNANPDCTGSRGRVVNWDTQATLNELVSRSVVQHTLRELSPHLMYVVKDTYMNHTNLTHSAV